MKTILGFVGGAGVILLVLWLTASVTPEPTLAETQDGRIRASSSVVALISIGSGNIDIEQTQEQAQTQPKEAKQEDSPWGVAIVGMVLLGVMWLAARPDLAEAGARGGPV